MEVEEELVTMYCVTFCLSQQGIFTVNGHVVTENGKPKMLRLKPPLRYIRNMRIGRDVYFTREEAHARAVVLAEMEMRTLRKRLRSVETLTKKPNWQTDT